MAVVGLSERTHPVIAANAEVRCRRQETTAPPILESISDSLRYGSATHCGPSETANAGRHTYPAATAADDTKQTKSLPAGSGGFFAEADRQHRY